MGRSALYNLWSAAKSRCFNPNNHKYLDYGGRGITMVDAWKNDFTAFLRDMGPRPPGRSLDRIDNDGPYSPDNCRWATKQQQMSNMRSNHTLEHQGQTMTVSQWERALGFKAGTIKSRIYNGWSIERALSEPVPR